MEVWDDPSVEWRAYDIVVVRSTWDYVEKLEAFRRWIDAVSGLTRLVNDARVLRWNLHKRYLLELAAHGVDIVPTTLVAAGDDADWDALFERYGELVLKPAVSAGSFATIRVARGDRTAAEEHLRRHRARDFLVQPLLRSVLDQGEINLVSFGGTPSHAVRKGARWSGQSEQSRGLAAPSDAELALASRALGAAREIVSCDLSYARVDMAADSGGRPLLMELELLEPALFLDRRPNAAEAFVGHLIGGGASA